MRLRQRLLSLPPSVGALVFLAVLLGGRLILNWAIHRMHPNLHFWSVISQLLGAVLGSVVASLVVYLLLRSRRRQRELLGMLNHELRNALQVIAYMIPHTEPAYREAARGAIDRMKKVVREISHKLGG